MLMAFGERKTCLFADGIENSWKGRDDGLNRRICGGKSRCCRWNRHVNYNPIVEGGNASVDVGLTGGANC